MKVFENQEVWFVTGAQLLYGGDAVVQVDGHSQKMVDGMNSSGILPVKLVYKGTANSSAEVTAVMRAAQACRNSVSPCFISTPSSTRRFPGPQSTWIS